MKEPRVEMKSPAKILPISLLFLFICLLFPQEQSSSYPYKEKIKKFFDKEEVTIAFTDSGLGGLSIMAEAVERLRPAGIFRRVHLIFTSALFSNEGGYNSLKSREEKILIFNSALQSLEKNYRPDLVLIGCNTLSALYEETRFSKESPVPVVGIVESGVDLLVEGLRNFPGSAAIIFGTPTTIEEATHLKKLRKQGFAPERIFLQACPELENYIERSVQGEETEMLIDAYVEEALQKIPDPKPKLLASLNCTHYGYSLELWKKAFASRGLQSAVFLNPNSRMLDFLFEKKKPVRFAKTEVDARVISMVEISQERISSIASWLQGVSPLTAEALRGYELQPDLFEWKKFISY
jgi:glutamate racemase